MYGVVESLLSPVIEDFSSLPIARLFAYFSTCEDVAEFFRVQLLLWREYFQCAPRSFIFQRPELDQLQFRQYFTSKFEDLCQVFSSQVVIKNTKYLFVYYRQ